MGTGTLGASSAGQCTPHRSWGSPHLPQPCPAVQLEELVAVHYEEGQKQGQRVVLGTGGFGRVELVRAVPIPRAPRCAIPVPIPDQVVRTRQQEHMRTERRVLARSHCPFIHIYLLLEFCQGGELWTKLRERCFEEPLAVFCSACVVEGLEYLHGHGIVYRDLKPENLMLDQLGYVKLVDFGFAKELERGEKTFSFCGTPEYLAPEMLCHEGHDFAVDFWMLGILVFEMLVGRPPFHSTDPQKIYSRILDGIFSFPAFLSEAACSLIAKLCRRRPGQRLGNTASGIRGIKKHRWFGAIRWKRLALRQMEAPTIHVSPASSGTMRLKTPSEPGLGCSSAMGWFSRPSGWKPPESRRAMPWLERDSTASSFSPLCPVSTALTR
uniref:Protein kinase domain-containing protein n=1 Tax=Meleagris gallopavo TaxID=9103 RepID=H9H1Y3_MELGA